MPSFISRRLPVSLRPIHPPILIGAGLGDPEYLTIAGRKALDSADLVVSDQLIGSELLSKLKCEIKLVPKKTSKTANASQQLADSWVIEGVQSGLRVVRLKGGDPFLFGRGGEEVLTFRRTLGLEPIVIPGISSALAAPLLANIPVTHRGTSDSVLIITGRGENGTLPCIPPYYEKRTLIVLMPLGKLNELVNILIHESKYPKSTPCCILERMGQGKYIPSRILPCLLHDLVDTGKECISPSIVVIGGSVNVLNQN